MKRPLPTELNKHIQESPNMQKLLHKRKKIHRIIRISSGIIFVLIVVGAIILLRTPRMQIYSITVTGNEITDTDSIIQNIQNSLSGTYAYIIPKTSIFFYPKQTVYSNLITDFQRFDSIKITLVNKTNLVVAVTEEKGTALWCGADSDVLDFTIPCYFTDTDGKIIDRAPYYSGNVYLRFFGNTASFDVTHPLGQYFVYNTEYHKLVHFANNVASLGFAVKAVRVGAEGDDYFILDLDGTHMAYVHFKADDNYDVLFSNLATAITNSALLEQVKNNKSNLEYFDLRFTNKVYYKFSDTSTSTKSHE